MNSQTQSAEITLKSNVDNLKYEHSGDVVFVSDEETQIASYCISSDKLEFGFTDDEFTEEEKDQMYSNCLDVIEDEEEFNGDYYALNGVKHEMFI